MMKGLIFDIKHFSVNDGPGIRTTVFFKGCPLSCFWCHNPEGRKCQTENIIRTKKIGSKEFHEEELIGKEMTSEEIIAETEKDILLYEESGGGVTLSGGEPLMQFDFLLKLLPALKDKGYNVALDTTGYSTKEQILKLSGYIDIFLFDIKIFDNTEHIKYTGVSNEIIFENLSELLFLNKEVIIRFPVIPGINDGEDNVSAMKKYFELHIWKIKELHLLPYHNIAENKYKMLNMNNKFADIISPDDKNITELKAGFEKLGLKVKIGG